MLRLAVEFDVDSISVDQEEEGAGGEGADKEYDDNGDYDIKNGKNTLETQPFLLF